MGGGGTHEYLAAGPGKLCLLLSLCLFRKRKKISNGEKMSQEIKPEKGTGRKETNMDETAQQV